MLTKRKVGDGDSRDSGREPGEGKGSKATAGHGLICWLPL